jgi:hypothetical protein
MSLKDKIANVNAKIDIITKTLQADDANLKIDKETQDLILKDAKELQKNIGVKLEKLKAKLKDKKLKKKNKTNIFEEMLKTVSKFLETGRKANETDRFASIQRLKYHAYGSADVTMRASRKIIMDCAKKVLFAGNGICGDDKAFDAQHNSCRLSPKEFDFFNMLRVPPDSDYGKVMYETKNTNTSKEKINRELYSTFTSLTHKYQYDTPSNKTLFVATWLPQDQEFSISGLSRSYSGSTTQNPKLGDFFDDYYSNMDMPDLANILKQAMLLTTKAVKVSADSTGVAVGGSPTGMEDNLSFTPDLDKAINDFERFINKIFAFCNQKSNSLGKQTTFNSFSEDDEDANFYFDFDDVEGIDLEDEDARRRKVLIFKDCNNFEVPYNANHMEDFIYLEGKKSNDEWVNITLDKVASDAFEQSFGGIQLPDFQISINLGFIINIPKSIIMALLSPKIILPIAIIYKLFIGVAMDVKDLMKKMKEWVLCIVNELFWKFIREFWKRIKTDLKNFLLNIVRKILKDKLKRYYYVISALMALLKKIIEDGIESCDDLFEVIGSAIDIALDLAGAKTFSIPLPLLLIADKLPGFSNVKATMEAHEKMRAMGIPTGPVNGEPNYFTAAFDAFGQAYTNNLSKTPIITTNKTMKGMSASGPVVIPPMQGQSGGLLKI